MLAAPGAARRNRTGIPSLGGWNTSRCVSAARWLPQVTILPLIRFRDALIRSQLESRGREGMVGKQGLEPHPPAPKAGALTLTLHPVNPILFSSCRLFLGNGGVEWFGGDERNRTAGLLLARQPLSQLSYIPEAAPGPPGVGRAAGDSNSQRPGPGIRHSHPGGPPCSWCSRCGVINWHARSPAGGAPQGWQDSNPRHAVLETAVLAAELHPYTN